MQIAEQGGKGMCVSVSWARLGQAVADCNECAKGGQLCEEHIDQRDELVRQQVETLFSCIGGVDGKS